MTKFLWALKPFVMFIDKFFTIPHIFKKVTGRVFYAWYPRLKKGMVFITDTRGVGSNLLNPSPGKHGAIYFGTGLRTALDNLIFELLKDPRNASTIERIQPLLNTLGLADNVPYVIESTGEGTIFTDLVTFLTHKDRVRVFEFQCEACNTDHVASLAADASLIDLGLPYDYGFTISNSARYCFELVALAYRRVWKGVDIPTSSVLGHESYQATSFLKSTNFKLILDSETI